MIRTVARLPFRALKRALSLLDGERTAPSPAPPMAPVVPPAGSSPVPETPEAPKKVAAKKAVPKKAAPKKAAPKKAAAKKAAPKKKVAKKSSITVDPQDTPNPNAIKFTLNIPVAETGSFSFTSEDSEIEHSIAAAVVALDGVVSVFGVNDFLTVSKAPDASWNELMPLVVDAIKGCA
jgi:hypothetical protein